MSQITSAQKRLIILHALLIFVGSAMYLYIIAVRQPTLNYWDASWYANSARHMINGGYWIIPHLHYDDAVFRPFVEKPPLGMWIQAVSMSIFGVSSFAARLPSVFAGIGIALLTLDLGRRWFNWETGIAAGLLFYVQPLIFRRGHSMWTADIEMLFLFFGVAFVYTVIRAVEGSSRWFYVAGIAAGCAVLTKGVAAGVFLIILVPVAIRCRQTLVTREAIFGALASFTIGGSWHLLAYLAEPKLFIEIYLINQVLQRSAGELATYGGTFSFMNYPYFIEIPLSYWIFTPLLSTAILVSVTSGIYSDDRSWPELFLVWWFVSVYILFAVIGGNHLWYIKPTVIPAVLLMGALVSRLWRLVLTELSAPVSKSTIDVMYIVGGLAAVVLLIGVMTFPANTNTWDNNQRQFADKAEIPSEKTVYYDTSINGSGQPRVFSFYERNPMKELTRGQIQQLQSDSYVIASSRTLEKLDGEYEVVHSNGSGETVLIHIS